MFFNILCHFVLDYEGISMCILYLTIYVVNFAIPKDFPVLRHCLAAWLAELRNFFLKKRIDEDYKLV